MSHVAAAFKQAAQALYEGNEDLAASLLSDGATIAAEQVAAKPALAQLALAYPEILEDAVFARLAETERLRFMDEGKTMSEAIALAGDVVGERYAFGKYKLSSQSPQQQAAGPDDDEELANTQRIIAKMAAARTGR